MMKALFWWCLEWKQRFLFAIFRVHMWQFLRFFELEAFSKLIQIDCLSSDNRYRTFVTCFGVNYRRINWKMLFCFDLKTKFNRNHKLRQCNFLTFSFNPSHSSTTNCLPPAVALHKNCVLQKRRWNQVRRSQKYPKVAGSGTARNSIFLLQWRRLSKKLKFLLIWHFSRFLFIRPRQGTHKIAPMVPGLVPFLMTNLSFQKFSKQKWNWNIGTLKMWNKLDTTGLSAV